MAIAFDTSTQSSTVSTGTTITLSHTCTGTNGILFVGVSGIIGDVLSGVTYGGVAMTQTAKLQVPADRYVYLYHLVNPATGANDIVATNTITLNNAFIFGASYTGAKQTGQPDATNTNSAVAATTLATSVTTVADNCWVVGMFGSSNVVFSAGTGVTERQNKTAGLASLIGDSNAAKTPAGSYSMTVNCTGSANMAALLASFAPAVAAGPTNLKSLNTNVKSNIKSLDTNVLANIKSIDTNA